MDAVAAQCPKDEEEDLHEDQDTPVEFLSTPGHMPF